MTGRKTLIVDATTTAEDLVEFVVSRARPLEIGGSLIYDFTNHPFDAARFEASTIPPGRYVIPFSMSDVNVDLFELLPMTLRALPRLRFNPRAEVGGYSVQPSLLPSDTAAERRLRVRLESEFAAG